jgi:phosphoserine phosphatase RsbU/P
MGNKPRTAKEKATLEVYQDRIRRLEAVVEASALVNSALELRTIAEIIVSVATRLIGAEAGSVFLLDHGKQVLRSLVAAGVGDEGLLVRSGEGIVGAVAATGDPIVLDDPYRDPRFARRFDELTGFRTRSLLTVPVRDRDGKLVAVLQLLNHRNGGFKDGDVAFLAELGVPFAIALATARLHEEIVARERLAEDVRLAGEIQQTLQPRDLAVAPGLEIAARWWPSREVGGDFFDLIPARGGTTWLVIADVSGKGIPAALIASNIQAYLWSRRADRRPLQQIITDGNELLYGLTQGKKYATLILAEWHPGSGLVHFVNAGHPPALVVHHGGIVELGATGPPLGLLPSLAFDRGTARLRVGDSLLMYTDGVIEAGIETDLDEFGVARVAACLARGQSSQATLDRVSEALAAHLGEHQPHDDVTMLSAVCRSVSRRPSEA